MPFRFAAPIILVLCTLGAWLFHASAQASRPLAAVVDLHHDPAAPAPLTWEEQSFPESAPLEQVRATQKGWSVSAPINSRPLHLPALQVLWARFELAPYGALTPPHWWLEFPRPSLDRVELYRLVDGELALQEISGDAIPVAAWPLMGRSPMFEVTPTNWAPVMYYVRLAHRGPTTLQARLWRAEEAQRRQWMEHLVFGALSGGLAFLVALSTASMAKSRRLTYGSLALYGLALSLALLGASGLLGELAPTLSANLSGRLPALLSMVAAAAGVAHLANAVSLGDLSPRLSWVVGVLVGMGVLMAAGVSTSRGPHEFIAVAYLAVAGIAALTVLEVGRRGGDAWTAMQIASFCPLLPALAVPVGEALGWWPLTPEDLIVIFLLALLHLTLQYFAVDAKTTALTKSNARLQASTNVDPLTGLANYRSLLERMPALVQRAGDRRSPAAVLMIELVTEGLLPQGGPMRRREHVILRAAELVRSCARDNHVVARIDDTHFALTMESPATLRDAADVASHIVAKGLRLRDEPPQHAPLVFRIVISMLPPDTIGIEDVLAAAARRLRSVPLDNPRRIFLELAPQDGRPPDGATDSCLPALER